MGAIRLTNFGGIIPRTSQRLIPDNAAQIAVNCNLSSGELVPHNTPKQIGSVANNGPLQTLFRAYEGGDYAWFSWDTVVYVVKAPLYGTAKWCCTGDGEPRITNMYAAKLGGGNGYPNTMYTLGTPKPITAPAVGHSGGTGAATSRYYCYTFRAAWDGVEFEGAISPLSALVAGKVDGTWAISGMDAAPPSSGTVTGSYAAGYTTFTDALDTFLRTGEEVVIASTKMTVTVLTSKTFKVAGDYSAATSWARKAAFVGTITKCLYRSTDGTTAQFQLVAENITTTTFNDTLTASQIPGDELISSDWDMPPVGLTGLFYLPSGALGGWIGNKLLFSEPNQPHAWPSSYAVACDYPVVAAASFGTGVGAATEARPFIVTGVEPGQMSGQHWEEVIPCVAPRSMVSLGDMALFASPFGFTSINGSGCQNWSLPYFTKTSFQKLAPETMSAAVSERKLFVRYNDGVSRVLIFNLGGDDPYLTAAHFNTDTLYADAVTGKLYFSDGSAILEFDPSDGYAMSQEWMSKEIVLPKPMNLGAAKVNFNLAIDPAQKAALEAERAAVAAANAPIAATGKVNGGWNAKRYHTELWNGSDLTIPPAIPPENEVTFQLYTASNLGHPVLRVNRTVVAPTAFSLPSGYKADTLMVKVVSQCPIKSIELGPTKQSLETT